MKGAGFPSLFPWSCEGLEERFATHRPEQEDGLEMAGRRAAAPRADALPGAESRRVRSAATQTAGPVRGRGGGDGWGTRHWPPAGHGVRQARSQEGEVGEWAPAAAWGPELSPSHGAGGEKRHPEWGSPPCPGPALLWDSGWEELCFAPLAFCLPSHLMGFLNPLLCCLLPTLFEVRWVLLKGGAAPARRSCTTWVWAVHLSFSLHVSFRKGVGLGECSVCTAGWKCRCSCCPPSLVSNCCVPWNLFS